ncbi:phytanoyl-CoA dioxygenase family protein [uncultured Nostoc sp.]|uniref:phytanoyl-CoA dioxygenase family protein n=1 Tax=uncultured Nostoc sp. TaxID=340711 RepID=UPI0035CC9D7F
MRNVFLKAENQREFETKGYSTMPMLSSQEVNLVLSELQLMKPDNNFNAESSSEQPSYHLTDFDSNIEYKIKAKQLITSILEPHLKNIFDNYKIITTNFIIKPPGKGKFPVHQDWTFVLDRKNSTSLTLWCPLVDTNEENGTLQVVEGSHKIVPDIVTSTVDFDCKNFEDEIVEKHGKIICLQAGECLVFDHSLLHFSDDNHTDQPRYVMQAILVPSEIDPVFYYFDVNEPKKGFEVFQTEPDFFVFQDFFKRPSNLKSLGFIENQNRLLTEEEFIEKMQKVSHSPKAGSSSLISVKPSGYKRPFFYIHGADGHTIDTVLGQYIDRDRPFYGIRAVGRDGKGIPHTCVEEMAAYYIQEIQTVQPEGPYLLGGRCSGGNIALEMAQQLKKRGHQVLLVVMVDSPKPLLTEEEKVEYPNAIAREQMRWRGKLINDDSNPSSIEIDFNPKVFEYNLQIPANYIPQIYSGRVVYFAAQERSKDSFISELLQPNAWNRWVINGVEVYEVPGDHLSMTKEPNVRVLAEKLSTCLDRAECEDKTIESNGEQFSIDLELETKGYTVTDFFGEDEVQSLLKFHEENSSPKDILESILSATRASSDLSYRQRVSQKLKKIFIPKLKVLFPNHRILVCTFVNKSDWWFYKLPPLLPIAYTFDDKRIIHQEIETKGYAVISFLNENEVKSLISFYKKQSIPDDMVASPGTVFSIHTIELSYRQKISQEVKKAFNSKLKTLFPNYRIAFGVLGYKKPDASSSKMDLHQDCSLTDETVMKSLGVWCPLIDVDQQNGCLQVVNRSHLLNSKARPFWGFIGFPYSPEVLSLMQEHYLTNVPMKAGQALIYDKRLFHGSPPNLTTNERVAAICALVPQGVMSQFYYRESQTSDKMELFEVEDEFYDRYIAGQKPEGVKSLGTFDYEADPLTPEQLVEFMNSPQAQVNKDTGFREKLLSFFNLVRGSDWWFYKIPPLLAIAYAEVLLQATPPLQFISTLVALLISMFFVAAYGHVVNDIFDIEVDLQAGKHNGMASLSKLQRFLLSASLAVAGLIPWLFIGINAKSTFLLATIYTLLTIYSAPPLRLKERGIWGVITDAAQVHAVPTLLVATVFSDLASIPQAESATLATVATGWAFLAGIRGIVLHQIWDRENDLKAGVKTLVTKIGLNSARFGISYIVFPIEFFLLGLLVWVISQFAPLLLVFFILYILLKVINAKLGLAFSSSFETAPAEKVYVFPHDLYDVWLPLALVTLVAGKEVLFALLLSLHFILFHKLIKQRVNEFIILMSLALKLFISSLNITENQPAQKILQTYNESIVDNFNQSSHNKSATSLARAIDFLYQNQLHDGEFQTETCQRWTTPAGEVIEKWLFDSSPFATSLVLYSLSFLKYEKKVQKITEKGLSFLLNEMELGGLWRYWSSKNERHRMIPPDLDDICCISYVLKMNNISLPNNIGIVMENRNKQGVFYTWLFPNSLRKLTLSLLTLGKAFSNSKELWELTNKDDVCCGVNANVLLYLGESQQTQKVINYLITIVLAGNEDSNTSFYNHKLSFYYMLSRAYFNGVNSLRVVKITIINKILNLQKTDGSFGDELLTALAVCIMLNFNYQTPSLDRAIEFLLKTQQQNGSWQRIPMYGGQLDKATFGSAELTTAIAVEALARYCLLDISGHMQQSQAELQTQLQQTEQELTQSQSQLYATQTESAQLNYYLQQTQGVMSYYRFRIASNPDDIQLYYQALEVKPDEAQIHLQLGNALVRQNRFCEAIATYQTALQFHPNNFEIHLELAKALEKEQKWEDAIAAYRRAIELNPDYSWSHKHLGDILAERGQLNDASTSYRRALQLQPRIF